VTDYEIGPGVLRTDFHVLYRAVRRRDGLDCLLKLPRTDPPRSIDLDLLRREYETMRTLDLTGVVRPIELTRGGGREGLAFESCPGEPLRSLRDRRREELGAILDATIRLCDVLADLHRCGTIHGSVHPGCALFEPRSGELKLVELAFAVRGDGEGGGPLPLHLLQERLPYLAPEQTGRFRGSLDHRADLYSVGATLYELLTGEPPFRSADPLEVIHAHVARQPRSPAGLEPSVPAILSEIVMKLLAKSADHRYQSAIGLRRDLSECRRQLRELGSIAGFVLGRRDVSERFTIPRSFYGRRPEIERLQRLLDDVRDGQPALALVSGYSGIGKTSLVRELYRPFVAGRGVFVTGKCDQYVQSVPYGPLIQAFRTLVQQLLALGELELAVWRDRLTQALGVNGGVIAEVIPAIELILGAQPAAQDLEPKEAQNRFRLVLQRFVGTLARPDHPLVVFVDDLQWVDVATLELMETMLTGPDVRFLLLIGAYRDNEVDESHPLTGWLRRLDAAGAHVEAVSLGPLSRDELEQLTAGAVHADADAVVPLARVVEQKTAGNPFFAGLFLRSLHESGLLVFDRVQSRWTWDLDGIGAAPITDNVVDLMAARIRRLPTATRDALGRASCLGGSFDLELLATVFGESAEQTSSRLDPALAEGLLVRTRPADEAPSGIVLAFLHDRVQQAAYAEIADADRGALHVAIGRVLLERRSGTSDARLFDIVHHLNLGRELIERPAERLELGRLNLEAARKAKLSAAFREALRYAWAGCEVLHENGWAVDPSLTLELHLEQAECEYLCGEFASAEGHFTALLSRASTGPDQARVRCLMVQQLEILSRYDDAVRVAREGLSAFGLALPESAEAIESAIELELVEIEHLRAGRPIEALTALPLMEEPGLRAMMRLLTTVWAPAYVSGGAPLTRLISALMVRLSLEHGNTEESAYGYVTHAITVGPIRGDYAAAYDWGTLALSVNERLNDRRLRAKVHQQFQAHVNLWRRPHESCIAYAREACRSGLESGDLTYAGYGAFTESWAALMSCQDLGRFVDEITPSVAVLHKLRMPGLADAQRLILGFAKALRGLNEDPTSLTDTAFQEQRYRETYEGRPFFLTFLHVLRLYLAVVFGDYHAAEQEVGRAHGVVRSLDGTLWPVLLQFLEGLTLAARATNSAPVRLRAIHASLSRLAAECPANFGAAALLLEAETSRLLGRDRDTLRLYEESIRHASEARDRAVEAIATEALARFCLGERQMRRAERALRDARDAYARWGALAKVRQLESRHAATFAVEGVTAAVIRPSLARSAAPRPEPVSFDIGAFAKAASAIASDLMLGDLLRRMVAIVMENAGAERGVLLREQSGRLTVEAAGRANIGEVRTGNGETPLEDEPVCEAIVHYVCKTGECAVVADACADERFAGDPYVVRVQPRSIACLPLIHLGRTVGILYLENNLAPDAFSEERVRVVSILCGQAAISLENARLYEDARREVERRRRAEADLRAALTEVEKLKNRLEAENVLLQEEIRRVHDFDEIVGSSPPLLELLEKVERVAPTDSTVLLCGETGTGKELVARAIHNRSRRRGRPLACINCGAIPRGLVESELFGHVRGAFTGALDRRVGRFESASGGTIFLDEVGELPAEAQVKLLRVLQEKKFEPVGGSRTVIADVRVVAATNRDLEKAVRDGSFRADLYYRLSVVPLRVPPLRERVSDIPALVKYFLARFGARVGRQVDSISREAMERLVRYPWPGNVRELQNVIERAVVLSPGSILELGDGLQPLIGATGRGSGTLEEVERQHILETLRHTNGVIEGPGGAARILDLNPSTLRSRMKKLGIRGRSLR